MGLIGIDKANNLDRADGSYWADEANNLIGLMGLIRLIGPMPKKRKGASHHVKLLFFFI